MILRSFCSHRFGSLLVFLASITAARADVRLLTGDIDNNLHQASSTLEDISSDGDLVLFTSGPPVTGSTPGITTGGLYLRRVSSGALTYAGDPVSTATVEASMSDDGRFVAWRDGNSNGIYWRDVQTNTTRLVTAGADAASRRTVMSADGRYVAFASAARNIVADPSKLKAAGRVGIYLYDSSSQTIAVASLTSTGAALATGAGSAAAVTAAFNEFDLSADGRYLVFSSDALNVSPDRPATFAAGHLCIYRRDLQSGAVIILNRNAAGTVADGNFSTPRVSADGSRAAFFGGFVGTFGSNVRMIPDVANGFGSDLYVKDAATGDVWRASTTTDNSNPDGVFNSFIALSADGGTVAFGSTGTKFVSGNTDTGGGNNGAMDLFRADLNAGGGVTTALVTVSPNGSGNVDFRVGPLLSGTGDYAAFSTSQIAAMTGTGNTDTIHFQGFGVGTFPAGNTLTFSGWAAGLPAGMRGYNDNPAGDSVPNLTKFVMGMDASRPDVSNLPALSVKTGAAIGLAGDNSAYLTLQVRVRRNLPAGITWKVRAAATLAGLAADSGSAILTGAPAADGEFDLHLYRSPGPLTGTGFMDVRITAP